MSRTFPFLLAATVLIPTAALAAHGKAGLWTTSATTRMAMDTNAPSSHSSSSQMCMSQEEVESDAPPHIDQEATGCTMKVTAKSGPNLKAEMTCDGTMKGTGHMQITYNGIEHYSGSYSFKGQVEGNPTRMKTTFKGDWVKADCGDVKPYKLRTQ